MAFRLPVNVQRQMIEQGIVPLNCSSVELLIPAHGVMVLRYEVHLTAELLQKLGVVFQEAASELLNAKGGA